MSPCLLTGEHNYHLGDDQSLCFAALHWLLDVFRLFGPRNLRFLSPLVSRLQLFWLQSYCQASSCYFPAVSILYVTKLLLICISAASL